MKRLLLACMLLWTVVSGSTLAQASLAEDQVILYIEPTVTQVKAGDTFEIQVRLSTGERQVDGVQCFVDFNPKTLKALSVAPSGDYPYPLNWPGGFIDNDQGQINFPVVANLSGQGPSGDLLVFTLEMEALRPTIGTQLDFSREAPRATKLSAGTDIVVPTMRTGVIIVSTAPTPDHAIFMPLILAS